MNKNTFVFVCVFAVGLKLPRPEPAPVPVDEEPIYMNANREYDSLAASQPGAHLPLLPRSVTTVETCMSAFFPRPSLTCFCAQTAEALEEKPKGAPAPPAPEINPRRKAALNPVPAPRRLPSASSTPCIPSSAGSAETRMRTQSDSRGQSKSSSPRQKVGALAIVTSTPPPPTSSPLPQLPWKRCLN